MVIEKTTTGDVKLKETVTKEELLFYDINVHDFWMKPKFEKEYGCRHGPWCAGATMWTPVVLSLFAVLALVCSFAECDPICVCEPCGCGVVDVLPVEFDST